MTFFHNAYPVRVVRPSSGLSIYSSKYFMKTEHWDSIYKSSAVAEMGDRLATIERD